MRDDGVHTGPLERACLLHNALHGDLAFTGRLELLQPWGKLKRPELIKGHLSPWVRGKGLTQRGYGIWSLPLPKRSPDLEYLLGVNL